MASATRGVGYQIEILSRWAANSVDPFRQSQVRLPGASSRKGLPDKGTRVWPAERGGPLALRAGWPSASRGLGAGIWGNQTRRRGVARSLRAGHAV